MQRRSIVKAAAAAVSGALALRSAAVLATEATPESPPTPPARPAVVPSGRQLKMVLAWPRSIPGLGAAADRFADNVARLTDGRLHVAVFGAGDLVPAAETLDAVTGGIADIGYGSSYFWALRNPAFHFFTGVPFGFTAQEMSAWLAGGGGQGLWEELYKPFNIQPFYAGSTGAQPGGWFRRDVAALADLKGLRIRIAGLGAEVFKRLGAVPMMMPAAEIPTLLGNGQLDAVEWIGPWNDEAFGLAKLAKSYYFPGMLEPGPSIELIVNKKLYADLPRDQQAAIATSAAAAATSTLADFTYNNATTLPKLVKDGVELRRFPPEIVKAMARAAGEVVDGLPGTDALGKRIHASYQAFWQACRGYAPFAEGGYLAERSVAFA